MNRGAWRYYRELYRGDHPQLLWVVLASIGRSALQLPIVLLIRYAFDDVIPSRDLRLLTIIGVTIVVVYVINGGLALYTRYAVLRITKLVIQRLREQVVAKFYSLSRACYSEADRSKLHTIAVQDTERLDIMSNALIALVIPALLISAVLGAVLVSLDWRLFLVLSAILPPLVVASKLMSKVVRKRVRDFHRSFERFSRGILFVLQAMDLTRIHSAESTETRRQKGFLEQLRLTSWRMAWFAAAYSMLQDTIVAASGVLVLIVGGRSVALKQMTLGELFSFSTAVALLRTHLQTMSRAIPQIIEGTASLTTLYELMQTQDPRPYSGTKRLAFRGRIALVSVGFQYGEDPVLHDLNLTLEPGSSVALVGPNGVGKTTVAYLILGFYRPQKGQIFADDQPYDALDVSDLRRYIGVVSQDPIIFPGTIWENITYGCRDPTVEQVRQAAELATAHEFIEQLPQSYETFVGERGVLLSGGQRQRIAIARALLRQPRLLILDEPTNHLDRVAAQHVMDNLKRLDPLPARLMISHEMHIASQAQRVHILRKGHIVSSESR